MENHQIQEEKQGAGRMTRTDIILLCIVCLFLTIVNAWYVMNAPVISGSDVFHHNWTAQQIIQDRSIPSENPFSGGLDIQSFSPLLPLFVSLIAWAGHVDTIYIFIAIRLLIPAMYALTLFFATRLFFRSSLAGFFGVLLFFLFPPGKFIESYNILLDSKQANIANQVLVLIIIFLILLYRSKDVRVRRLFLIFLAMLFVIIPLLHQLTTFTLAAFLAALLPLLFFFFPSERKITLSIGALFLIGIAIVGSLYFNKLFSPDAGYLSAYEHSFTRTAGEDNGLQAGTRWDGQILKNTFSNAYHPILWLLIFAGMAALVIEHRRRGMGMTVQVIILLCWLMTFWFLALQSLGGYIFLPDRFLYLSTIPASVIGGYGLTRIIMILEYRRLRLIVAAGLMIFLTGGIVNGYSAYQSYEDVTLRELKSFLTVKKTFSHERDRRILADPLLAVKLISLSSLEVPYRFERTNLYRKETLTFDVVQQLIYGEADNAYQYIQKTGVRFIAVSADDKNRYYPDANYKKFDDVSRYREFFSANRGTEDELVIYEVRRPSE